MNCPHRENCANLKVHDTCYTVDIIVKKETVKYEIMKCDCGGVQEVAKRPAGISGTVTYGNRLKALVCVLSTKGMIAMKNLCEIIQGLTGIFENHPEQKWAREIYYELLSMCRAASEKNIRI